MSPLVIPVFLPAAGCSQQCLFCNQQATKERILSPSAVEAFVQASLRVLPFNKKNSEKQIAFYGGSFTAMRREDQVSYLKAIQPFIVSGSIHSIRVSTRPDALDEESLLLLKKQGVKTVEIGAQSMIDSVLVLAHRGHRAEETRSSVSGLRDRGFQVGLQLMIGLPGDTFEFFLQTLDEVIHLQCDFVRIHPTLVLRGAPLESLWRAGEYSPLPLNEAIRWLKKGLLKLERSGVRVARVGLQPTEDLERDLLAGPYHPALRQMIDSEIVLDMAGHLLQLYQKGPRASFFCHPKEVSNLRGQNNENISKLKEQFGIEELLVQGREDVPRGSIILQTQRGDFSICRSDVRYEN